MALNTICAVARAFTPGVFINGAKPPVPFGPPQEADLMLAVPEHIQTPPSGNRVSSGMILAAAMTAS